MINFLKVGRNLLMERTELMRKLIELLGNEAKNCFF